jgi:hypothetical protein
MKTNVVGGLSLVTDSFELVETLYFAVTLPPTNSGSYLTPQRSSFVEEFSREREE